MLARALVSGASACCFLALGMVLSDLVYLVLACYGLAALAEHWSEAAVLPIFTELTVLSRSDMTLVSFLTLLGLMHGLMIVAFGASSARRYMTSSSGRKTLNRIFGSVMIGAGVYLASSG